MSILDGRIAAEIARLALPVVASLCLTTAVQMGGASLIGHLERPGELLLLSLYLPFSFLVVSLIEALEISIQVVVAKQRGHQASQFMSPAIWRSLTIATVLGAAIVGVGFAMTPQLAQYYAVGNPERFVRFFRAMIAVWPLLMINGVLNGSLRGLGRTGVSFAVICASGLAQIGTLYWLVVRRGGGVTDMATAAACSAGVTVLLNLIVLARSLPQEGRFKWGAAPPGYAAILTKVGVPIFISFAAIFLSSALYNKILADFGPAAVSGFFVAFRIQSLAVLPAIGFASGVAILVNQALGGSDTSRAYEICRAGIGLIALAYIPVAIGITILEGRLTGMLAADAAVRAYADSYLHIVAPTYLLAGPAIGMLTIWEHIGKGMRALVLQVGNALAILAAGQLIAARLATVEPFYAAFGVGNVVLALIMWWEMRRWRRELRLQCN